MKRFTMVSSLLVLAACTPVASLPPHRDPVTVLGPSATVRVLHGGCYNPDGSPCEPVGSPPTANPAPPLSVKTVPPLAAVRRTRGGCLNPDGSPCTPVVAPPTYAPTLPPSDPECLQPDKYGCTNTPPPRP